jgi:hypothetical protein
VGGGAVTVGDDYLGTLVVEAFCEGAPDAVSRTGDDRGFSAQFHWCDVTHSVTHFRHPCDMVRP